MEPDRVITNADEGAKVFGEWLAEAREYQVSEDTAKLEYCRLVKKAFSGDKKCEKEAKAKVAISDRFRVPPDEQTKHLWVERYVWLQAVTAPLATPDDPTAYMPASKLCPEKGIKLPKAEQFCKRNRIRTKKPSRNRLKIHAGDWLDYWANRDASEFEGRDRGARRSVFDSEDIVIGGAAERLKALRQGKARRKKRRS